MTIRWNAFDVSKQLGVNLHGRQESSVVVGLPARTDGGAALWSGSTVRPDESRADAETGSSSGNERRLPVCLSTPIHKYNHVCGEGFLAQTRRERRAYPSGVCKERATMSGPKRTAARRVASFFGSGFVAPRSQPHFGGCSLVAPRQNRKSTQQTWLYL